MSGHPIICRYFASTGNCYYGDQCNFAHTFRPTEHNATAPPPPSHLPKNQRPCRNVAIHGFCKFAGKGCEYNHELTAEEKSEMAESIASISPTQMGLSISPPTTATTSATSSAMSNFSQSPKKDKLEIRPPTTSSSTTPTGFKSLVTQLATPTPTTQSQAQVFQPSSPSQAQTVSAQSQHVLQSQYSSYPTSAPHHAISEPSLALDMNAYARYGDTAQYGAMYPQSRLMSPTDQYGSQSMDYGAHYGLMGESQYYGSKTSSSPNLAAVGGAGKYYSVPNPYMPSLVQQQAKGAPIASRKSPVPEQVPSRVRDAFHRSMGGNEVYDQYMGGHIDPYYQTQSVIQPVQPPHPSSLPHTTLKQSGARRVMQHFFMSETLRQDMAKRSAAIHTVLDVEDPRYKDIPQLVHRYHSLYPLESDAGAINKEKNPSKTFGFPTSVFKCQSSTDGLPYALRRIEGFRMSNEYAISVLDVWRNLQHPNIVTLREAFITKEFGETSLVFAYDYHPLASTLEAKHFVQTTYIAENILWSYITQLVSALRTIHAAGLACRVINPSKILLTGKNRIMINGVGINDIVNFDPSKNIHIAQQEDYLSLGKLILSLASKSSSATQNIQKSIELVATHYSVELKNFIIFLLTKPTFPSHSIGDEVAAMINGYLLRELENLNNYNDMLEADLMKEMENGRLFRMTTKLGFINERPEFAMDPNWSETGDRYLLKLFRDYVFHQVYDDGNPMVDLAHVVECLNKLDAGAPEKIMLTSRDEQSMLVVSYKDLKRCVDTAFGELVSAAKLSGAM
eukprot:TRINITY_DN1649_c0_g4_i1.p1 TRINITY_DN1649_c0_g4~~TRINITY_DN1649_c0_g4_i1.p1  ORF type:complete len:791 (-),score=129.88 TRINITY_DN1649_c0_g4_i1:161-2533(-)